jgi:small subunit ribosomal protein S3
MGAGALGAEVVISGKLRSDRSRYEKFRDGYLAKSGDAAMKNIRKDIVHVPLKAGILGVKVLIMPPDAKFPDQVSIIEEKNQEKTETNVEAEE